MLIKGVVGLTVLASTALASNFFVHEDVLAHPMYSISLGQNPISNSTAQQLLKAEFTDQSELPNPSQQLQRIFKSEDAHTHLVMKSKLGQSYLCQIPIIQSDTSDTSKEESEIKISDAERKKRGLQLLAPLYNQCIYAWPRSYWAYEYCHLQHIKQFHAPPNSQGHVFPPGSDPENKQFVGGIEYVLGRFNGDKKIPSSEVAEANNKEVLLQTEVHTFGQRSYLSQRWSFGDKCDLTGRPREVNIQFHCSMQNEDEIVSMHEFATCEYQMVIATPRLCQDIAFVPRARQDIHRIQCDPIVSDSQYQEIEAAQPADPSKMNEDVHIVVDKHVEKKSDSTSDEGATSDEGDLQQTKAGWVDENDLDGYSDDLESKIASLEQDMVDSFAQHDKSDEDKAPRIHLLDTEFVNGMTLKDFMSSKSLEQQLEEITKILMEKISADKPSIEPKQRQFTARVQENLKAYKQKFKDEEEEEEMNDHRS
ncbi:hypothetical protein K450DRAFT_243189 [Umbelopsis ramanniana AG]|uniref:Protein OS-9 homolog n=1 Tax=Umbelopsis ramanniana AG TaxID=1314678 RepID=A0AAD5EA65_UMBRA|nr:uncharacterized protein K450DRAFT_243189 [Umbelopsis ramanniana AG]KAI8579191.1 hypothetical protein K450DRAFT_243189 [Umbelopsis ramanniana AG]